MAHVERLSVKGPAFDDTILKFMIIKHSDNIFMHVNSDFIFISVRNRFNIVIDKLIIILSNGRSHLGGVLLPGAPSPALPC